VAKILVVHNDPDVKEDLKWAARGSDREVLTAANAEEALRLIEENDFDVIVTDLRMKTKEAGLDVLKGAKQKNRDTQVILCTAYGTKEASVEAMRLGAFDYLDTSRHPEGVDFLTMIRSKIELALHFREGQRFRGSEKILGAIRGSDKWPQVFVLMPFAPNLRPVFEDSIKKVVSEAKLTVGRADDFFRAGAIVNDIWSAISAARVIVADCTGRNPNVFYEIGLAHAIGKETVLITQSLKDIPFDLRHLRVIEYEFTPRGMATFETDLSKAIADTKSAAT